jgi:membrane-bound lytic murein transglycosylase D
VSIDYAVDLRLVADVTEASLPEIVGLNPSLLRMTTPRDLDFDLHLPPGTKDAFMKRIAEVPEDKRSSWRFHIVRPGESLETIASSLHTRATEIALANHLTSADSIETGDELVVPQALASNALHPPHYVTRIGDTLVAIADRFNVSVEQLRRWNHLTSSTIAPHRTLAVSEPVHLAPTVRPHAPAAKTTAAAPKPAASASKVAAAKKTAAGTAATPAK